MAQLILRVSEVYAWSKRGTKTKRVFPNAAVRAVRKNAECMALLKGQTSEQLNSAAEGLRYSPLVSRAEVLPTRNGPELVVYSRQGLVTKRDQLDFIQQVRYKLMQTLLAEVVVKRFSFR
jgi:hypothetical protein